MIVDYGLGNLQSIFNMLRSASVQAQVSADPDVIRSGSRLILAGVGAFDAGMARLGERHLVPVLQEMVLQRGVPVLGICLGMQLLMRSSAEGMRPGLGWIDGCTVRLASNDSPAVKVPHMGWNEIRATQASPLLEGLLDNTRFYFAHSYVVECDHVSDVIATAAHGRQFPAIIASGHIYGVQFHPEKSHRYGRQLLRNFSTLDVARC